MLGATPDDKTAADARRVGSITGFHEQKNVWRMLLKSAQRVSAGRRASLLERPTGAALLTGVVQAALKAQSSLSPFKGAVYVGVSESCLENGGAVGVAMLQRGGFAYHHYRPPSGSTLPGAGGRRGAADLHVPGAGGDLRVRLQRLRLRPPTPRCPR